MMYTHTHTIEMLSWPQSINYWQHLWSKHIKSRQYIIPHTHARFVLSLITDTLKPERSIQKIKIMDCLKFCQNCGTPPPPRHTFCDGELLQTSRRRSPHREWPGWTWRWRWGRSWEGWERTATPWRRLPGPEKTHGQAWFMQQFVSARDQTRQDTARQGKAQQDKSQNEAWGKTRQDTARQKSKWNTRQGKTKVKTKHKMRQDTARQKSKRSMRQDKTQQKSKWSMRQDKTQQDNSQNEARDKTRHSKTKVKNKAQDTARQKFKRSARQDLMRQDRIRDNARWDERQWQDERSEMRLGEKYLETSFQGWDERHK